MENPPPDRLDLILERLDYLDQTLHEQIRRIYALERVAGIAPPPARRAPIPDEVPTSPPAVEDAPAASFDGAPEIAEPRIERDEISEASKVKAASVKPPTDFEALLAGS